MSNDGKKSYTIYTDLDSVLDTRLATIQKHFPDQLAAALDAGYFTRKMDVFPGIDKDEFDSAYRHRDAETLVHALATKIPSYLTSLCGTYIKDAAFTTSSEQPEVTLNIYPYKLTGTQADNIRKVLTALVPPGCSVKIVNFNFTALAPSVIKGAYPVLVIYDYVPWFEKHGETLVKSPLITTKLAIPNLIKRAPTVEEQATLDKVGVTPTELFEKFLSPLISFEALDIRTFCVNIPEDKYSKVR